jgi:hypothetical protein
MRFVFMTRMAAMAVASSSHAMSLPPKRRPAAFRSEYMTSRWAAST